MHDTLVLNGPNLNLLGSREPEHYGGNAEHELVGHVQAAPSEGIDFIIINPAALTHTSVGLRDALSAVGIPFIEVHLSNIHAREEFRKTSFFSDIAVGVISGLGPVGYELALTAAVRYLEKRWVRREHIKSKIFFATETHGITRKNILGIKERKFLNVIILSPLPGPLPEGEGIKTLDSRLRGNDNILSTGCIQHQTGLDMDIRKVKKLIELLEESQVAEIEIHEGEESVRISRMPMQAVVQAAPAVAMAAPAAAAPPIAAAPALAAEPATPDGHTVTSPMVGTFYEAPIAGRQALCRDWAAGQCR